MKLTRENASEPKQNIESDANLKNNYRPVRGVTIRRDYHYLFVFQVENFWKTIPRTVRFWLKSVDSSFTWFLVSTKDAYDAHASPSTA